MSSAAMTTEWELKLRDSASMGFKKLQDFIGGSEKKLRDLDGAFKRNAAAGADAGREFKRSYGQLEDTLHHLEERQKQAFTTKHIEAYRSIINRTKGEMDKLNSVMNPKAAFFSKAGLQSAASEIPMLDNMMRMAGNPYVLAGAGIAAVGYGLKKATDLAVNFETGMAKVNATAQLSGRDLALLKNRLVDIGSDSGGNFERIPDAYEKILSQTNKVNLSLDITEQAVKGAKAGFTDIDVVAGALARTLSVVGEKNTTANEVLDTLFKAKQLGAGEFGEFAQFLPQLIAAGRNLSINFKDTAGMFAYMTAKGQSATDTAMLMENAFSALQKKQVIEGFAKQGMSLFNADGSRKNIKNVFLELGHVMDKMTDLQKTEFLIKLNMHDAQARNAFSVLTGDADKLIRTMDGVNNALGETNRQLAATGNHARDWGSIADEWKSWGVAIGDILLPAIDRVTHSLSKGIAPLKIWAAFFGQSTEERTRNSIDNKNREFSELRALEETKKKFNGQTGVVSGTEAFAFHEQSLAKWLGRFGLDKNNKNNIDKNESAAETALANVNAGKTPSGNDNSKTSTLDSSVSGEGSKVRNLTMNLQIHNVFKGDDAMNVSKIKKIITDTIVDAARDSMVTIGV